MKPAVKGLIIFALMAIGIVLIVVIMVPDFTIINIRPDEIRIEREGSQTTIPIPPNAVIHPRSGSYEVGEIIAFSAGESKDPDGKIDEYEWDFGDGSKGAVGLSTTYGYNNKGIYQVTLTVIDNDKKRDSTNSLIIVEPKSSSISPEQPKPPIAKISALSSSTVDEVITFSARNSEDPDGTITKYEWDFGDNSKKKFGKETSYVYKSQEEYNVILTVTDNDGLTNSVPMTITIEALPLPEFIPNPQLVLTSIEEYEVSGNQFVRYRLSIDNWNSYPPELFKQAPDLPPCGLNENAARTWMDIYNAQTNSRIYGFCALSSPNDLTKIWFAVAKEQTPPQSVYVELKDRQENKTYKSNNVSVT